MKMNFIGLALWPPQHLLDAETKSECVAWRPKAMFSMQIEGRRWLENYWREMSNYSHDVQPRNKHNIMGE